MISSRQYPMKVLIEFRKKANKMFFMSHSKLQPYFKYVNYDKIKHNLMATTLKKNFNSSIDLGVMQYQTQTAQNKRHTNNNFSTSS